MKKSAAALLMGAILFAPACVPQAAPVVSAQSLWGGGGYVQNIFADRRAHDVGDILTSIISESTTTSATKSSSNSKSGSVGLNAGVGLFTFLEAASASGSDSFKANGAASDTNRASGTVTVTVTEVEPNGNMVLEGKIDFGKHPFLDDFRFVHEAAGGALVKFTIPSPSMLHLICCVRATDYAPIPQYEDEDQLFHDIAIAYQHAIRAFYDAGCRYLQLDDTSWGEFCDAGKRKAYAERGFDLDIIAKKYVEMINLALEAKPADMVITMHICRGNFRSTWFSSGGYEPVAETLFGGCQVDGFFLEYDSERAGGFEPLRFIQNQQVVLGLVTSKAPELENEEDVIARIREAASDNR